LPAALSAAAVGPSDGSPNFLVRASSLGCLGVDDHVWDLWRPPGGGWNPIDVTARAGGVPAIGTAMTYLTNLPGEGGARRVTHRAADGHIWDLVYVPSGGWSSTDVTARTGAAPCPLPGPQTYITEFPGQQARFLRVVYRAADGHVWENAFNPSAGWSATDLTLRAGGTPAQYPPID